MPAITRSSRSKKKLPVPVHCVPRCSDALRCIGAGLGVDSACDTRCDTHVHWRAALVGWHTVLLRESISKYARWQNSSIVVHEMRKPNKNAKSIRSRMWRGRGPMNGRVQANDNSPVTNETRSGC